MTHCLGGYGFLGQVEVITLVVSELATNAVIHAETPFTVALARKDGSLVLEVRDRRAGGLPLLSTLPAAGPHGRGLQIVQALSTSWG